MNTNDIEDAIATLPEISEVMVLGILDASGTENVAALIKPSSQDSGSGIKELPFSLADLRHRLRAEGLLPLYKMPVVLRVLQSCVHVFLITFPAPSPSTNPLPTPTIAPCYTPDTIFIHPASPSAQSASYFQSHSVSMGRKWLMS